MEIEQLSEEKKEPTIEVSAKLLKDFIRVLERIEQRMVVMQSVLEVGLEKERQQKK
jgi:hypothetical protein